MGGYLIGPHFHLFIIVLGIEYRDLNLITFALPMKCTNLNFIVYLCFHFIHTEII